jgi:hypothetical protein
VLRSILVYKPFDLGLRGWGIQAFSWCASGSASETSIAGRRGQARTRRFDVMKGSFPLVADSCGPSPAMTLSMTFFRISLR